MNSEIIIRFLADGLLIPVVLFGAYALVFKIPNKQKLQSYKQLLLAGLTAYLIAKLASIIYQSTDGRPFEVIGAIAGASFLNNPGFPSDHVLLTTALTCAVWFETKQNLITIFMAGATVLIGVGRVLALVHTPADIIGGVVIALIGALWYLNQSKTSKSILVLPSRQK